MKIARILYPVTVLGPGKRIAIWVAGCQKRCPGCANPELWDAADYPELDRENLIRTLEMLYEKAEGAVDGITISGGEPFDREEDLLWLVEYLNTKTEDILIFSGHKKKELETRSYAGEILSQIAVLVDGEYDESKNQGEILRGSTNQNIHYLRPEYKDLYEKYQKDNEGHIPTENFRLKEGVVAVGIHKPDFKERLDDRLLSRHIVRKEKK